MQKIKSNGRLYFKEINRHLSKIFNTDWPLFITKHHNTSDGGLMMTDDSSNEMQDFLTLPSDKFKSNGNFKSFDTLQNGLKGFLQKLAVKPKEARMWLKYFQTSSIDEGLPFAVVLLNEDVFFQQKMMESMAWSFAFLVQNNMNPVIIFEVSRQPRRLINFLNGNEDCVEKMIVFAKYLFNQFSEFGVEIDLMLGDQSPLKMWKPRIYSRDVASTLSINTSSIFQSIQNRKIPVLCNVIDCYDLKPLDSFDILELLVSRFRPMKTMILGTSTGIVDGNNKVISDLAIPSDLNLVDSAYWLPSSQIYLLKRCVNMIQILPSSSSVIITAADTVIQELFTHHGSGTMIKRLEKISKYRSSHKIDKTRLNKLLEISFRKPVVSDYWESNEDQIDSIFVSERFMAAGVVLKLPNVDIPYLDKIAVHPHAQGSGLAPSLWNEICKDYPKLFWRTSRANESAAAWYNTVSQGSWKTDKWTVYWYGLSACEEVLPIVKAALHRPESFETISTPTFKNDFSL